MTSALDLIWRESGKLSRRGRRRKPLPPLLFFTDPTRTPDPLPTLAKMPRGSAIVYRAFGAPDALETGRKITVLARRRGVLVIIGADPALAIALRADGIHLPERHSDRRGVIGRLRNRFLVTAAAHSLNAIRRGRKAGANALVVSPVFKSASPSAGRPLGHLQFERYVRSAGMPVYALGGVTPVTVRRLRTSRAVGLATVSALSAPSG